ncbi:MAG: helix-turn-helix domain-containing protein [Polyangiaceae bacterium]
MATDGPFRFFAPRHRRDLEFYFRTTPGRLSERQRQKWYRIAEQVTGKETALPAFFRSSRREPFLDVAVAIGQIPRELADRYELGTDLVEERQVKQDSLLAAHRAIYHELEQLFGIRNASDKRPEPFEEIPVAEVARLRGVDEATIRRLIRNGELASSRAGFVRLNHADIRFFDENRNERQGARSPQEKSKHHRSHAPQRRASTPAN